MKLKLIQKIFIALTVSIIWSCSIELPCDYTDGVQLITNFYTYDGISVTDTSITDFELVIGNDTLTQDTLYYTSSTQSVGFSLSAVDDSSRIIIVYSDTISDTITFFHEAELNLESHPCGFTAFFELTDVDYTTNLLDSIRIGRTLVDYSNDTQNDTENIKIYF